MPFMKFDMSCVEKKIFEMCPDVTSITQVFKYATQICAANSTYNLMNGPYTKTPTKTLILSRKIVLFWKPFSGFCCTLKTANNEPIHFKLAVNHTGVSAIKWPLKVEHFHPFLLRVCVFLRLPYISAAQLRLGACAEGHIDRASPKIRVDLNFS